MLRMKKFNILGVQWKIRLLGKGGSRKTNTEGGDFLKRRGLGEFSVLRGDLARKRRGVFLRRGLIP